MNELADRLEMFASQLRESVEGGLSSAPHPWVFDDWLTAYRTEYETKEDTNNGN